MTTHLTGTALRFGIEDNTYRKTGPEDGDRYYRIELADGREALIIAATVTATHGVLTAADSDGAVTLALAPGTWVSVYMCEALMAYDPWSILSLAEPGQ